MWFRRELYFLTVFALVISSCSNNDSGLNDVGEIARSDYKIVLNADAISLVFKEECIALRNLDWVVRKSVVQAQECKSQSAGRCLPSSPPGVVNWDVSTTDGHSVGISLFWDPRLENKDDIRKNVSCRVSFDDRLPEGVRGLKGELEANDVSVSNVHRLDPRTEAYIAGVVGEVDIFRWMSKDDQPDAIASFSTATRQSELPENYEASLQDTIWLQILRDEKFSTVLSD